VGLPHLSHLPHYHQTGRRAAEPHASERRTNLRSDPGPIRSQSGANPSSELLRTWNPDPVPSRKRQVEEWILGTLARRREAGTPWTWGETRRALGGGVRSGEFRAAVDRLLRRGELIEARQSLGDRRQPRHVLLLVRDYEEGSDFIEVVAHPDVVSSLGLELAYVERLE
jgi:hypothetical protein